MKHALTRQAGIRAHKRQGKKLPVLVPRLPRHAAYLLLQTTYGPSDGPPAGNSSQLSDRRCRLLTVAGAAGAWAHCCGLHPVPVYSACGHADTWRTDAPRM